jgi:hypothetical protein
MDELYRPFLGQHNQISIVSGNKVIYLIAALISVHLLIHEEIPGVSTCRTREKY